MIDMPPTDRLALQPQESGRGVENLKLVKLSDESADPTKGSWIRFWIEGRWEASQGSGGRLKTTISIDEDTYQKLLDMETFMKNKFDEMNDTAKHRKRMFHSCLQDGTEAKIAMSKEPSPTGKFFCKFATHGDPAQLVAYDKIGTSMVGSDVLLKTLYVKIWASATQYGVTIDAEQVNQLNPPNCPSPVELGESWSTHSMAMSLDADGRNAYGKATILKDGHALPVILTLTDCRCLGIQQAKQEGKHKMHLKLEKPEDLRVLGALAAECEKRIVECPLASTCSSSDSMLFFHADAGKVVLQIDEDTYMEGGAILDDVVGTKVNVLLGSSARPYIMADGIRGATMKAKSIGIAPESDRMSSHDLRALSSALYSDVKVDAIRVGDREKIASVGGNRGGVEYISKCFGIPGIHIPCEGIHVKFDPDCDDDDNISKICLDVPEDLLQHLAKIDDQLREQSPEASLPWTSFIVRPEDSTYRPHLKLKLDANCLLSSPPSTSTPEKLTPAAIKKRTVLKDVGIEIRNVWYTKNQRGASMKLIRATVQNDGTDDDREAALRLARENLKRRDGMHSMMNSPKRARLNDANPSTLVDVKH